MRHTTDDIVLVTDAHLTEAMQQVLRHTGLLVEPAGAAGVAALIAHRARFAGHRIATPLCGSNVLAEQVRELFH
jgi:threonine dehydratase